MKEENKVLRKVVEQTIKDYYDLQIKFAAVQQNNQKKVSPNFTLNQINFRLNYTHTHIYVYVYLHVLTLFVLVNFIDCRIQDTLAFLALHDIQQPDPVPKILDGNNNQKSPSPSHESFVGESELGLTLRLQTGSEKQEREEHSRHKELLEHKEDFTSYTSAQQNKLQRTGSLPAGITSHVTGSTPPNRKARVSVRARCEAATVSPALIHNIYTCTYIYVTNLI